MPTQREWGEPPCSLIERVTARTVNGFIAFGPIPGCRGAASCRPPRSWPLGRRSGRVPALPYPPPRLLQCIGDHGHRAMPGLGQPRTTGQKTPPGTAGQDQEKVPGPWPRRGLLRRCGVGRVSLSSYHVMEYILEGGLSATGLRTSEATDLSCHLSQVVFAPLRGAPSVVSRGTDRGARYNLPYGQFGDRALGTIRSR